jgi:hypothetical protein
MSEYDTWKIPPLPKQNGTLSASNIYDGPPPDKISVSSNITFDTSAGDKLGYFSQHWIRRIVSKPNILVISRFISSGVEELHHFSVAKNGEGVYLCPTYALRVAYSDLGSCSRIGQFCGGLIFLSWHSRGKRINFSISEPSLGPSVLQAQHVKLWDSVDVLPEIMEYTFCPFTARLAIMDQQRICIVDF